MLRQFIARFRNLAVLFVATTTLGVAPLVACGVKGPLKLPSPTPAAGAPEARPAAAPTDPAAAPTPKPAEPRP